MPPYDAPEELNIYEKYWQLREAFLRERGYLLRARFRKDWSPHLEAGVKYDPPLYMNLMAHPYQVVSPPLNTSAHALMQYTALVSP